MNVNHRKTIKNRDEWNKHFNEALFEFDCQDCKSGVLPIFNGDKITGWI